MIKKVFWVLVVANAALFAYLKWGGALTQAGNGLQPALHADKIKLLGFAPAPVVQPASPVAPASAPVAAPGATPGTMPTVVPASPAKPASSPAQTAPATKPATKPAPQIADACLEWGEFSGTDLTRAKADLAGLKLGAALSQREVEHSIGYWVYIPPLKNRAAVNATVKRLKKRGIKDFFVVQEKGRWLHAISLNVFKTKEKAEKYRAHLRAKGIKDAVIGERQTRLKFTVFTFSNPDPATVAKLTEWQKGFTGIEMKSVTCK